MKKSIIGILLLFVIISCDDIPSEVVENNFAGAQITSLIIPQTFQPQSTSEALIVSAKLENIQNLSEIWFEISSADENISVVERTLMQDNGNVSANGDAVQGDNVFSGQTTGLNELTKGRYQIEIFSKDLEEKEKMLALNYIELITNSGNIAPLLSDLQFPISVDKGTKFVFSVKADDDNGLNDIARVYYELYDPSGNKVINSQGISEFPMVDTGQGDDIAAGDGIYTMALTFPTDFSSGNYRFDITAEDKSGEKSNVLTHTLEVK